MIGESRSVTAIAGLRICCWGAGGGSHASSCGTRQRAVPACRAPETRGRKLDLQEGTCLKESPALAKRTKTRFLFVFLIFYLFI